MGLKSVLRSSKEASSKKSAVRNESSRAEPVDEHKSQARRRLIGSVALLLIAIIVLPIVLEDEPKPVPEDIQLRIPSKDAVSDAGKPNLQASPSDENGSAPVASKPEVREPRPIAPPAKPDSVVAKPTPVVTTPEVPSVKTEAPPVPEAAKQDTLSKPETPQKMEPVKPVPKDMPKEVSKEPHKDVHKEPPKPVSKLPVVPADDPIAGFANKPVVAPTAVSKAPATATAPAVRSNHWVQIGAFSNETKAREIAGQIRSKGFPAVTEVIRNASGELYRVRVGPMETKESATRAKDNLSKSGFEGALIQ